MLATQYSSKNIHQISQKKYKEIKRERERESLGFQH